MSRTDPRRVWELALQAMNQDYPVYLRALKSPQTVASDSLGAAAPGSASGAGSAQKTAMYLRVHEYFEHRRTRPAWRAPGTSERSRAGATAPLRDASVRLERAPFGCSK